MHVSESVLPRFAEGFRLSHQARSAPTCCRYWNDPEVLKKLGSAMGDSVMPSELGGAGGVPLGWPAGENGAAGDDAGEAEGEEDEEHNVHSAASTGQPPI